MSYFKLVPKFTTCPYWKTEITINGKYILEDSPSSSVGKYSNSICPILENIRNQPCKEDNEYWMYPYCKYEGDCPAKCKNFPKYIDFNETPFPTITDE